MLSLAFFASTFLICFFILFLLLFLITNTENKLILVVIALIVAGLMTGYLYYLDKTKKLGDTAIILASIGGVVVFIMIFAMILGFRAKRA